MNTKTFNAELFNRRRIQAGHTFASLAAHLGVSPSTLLALQRGTNLNIYTYGFVNRIADALGVTVEDLATEHTPSAPPASIEQALGILVGAGGSVVIDAVADVTGLTPGDTTNAYLSAEPLLRTLGLTLAWIGDHTVTLLPALEHTPSVTAYSRRAIHRAGLRNPAAKAVWQLATGQRLTPQALHKLVLEELLATGTLAVRTSGSKNTSGDLELTPDTRYNLCLE